MKQFNKNKIILTASTSFGMYNLRLNLMRELKENQHKVIVIAPRDEFSELLEREFEFYELRNFNRKGTNPFEDSRLFFEYLNFYRKLKPNLVINYTIKPNVYSSIACGLLKIPSISVVTGLGYVFINEIWLTKVVRLLYKIAFGNNKFVISLNRDDLEVIRKIAGQQKSILLGSEGIDTSYFSPEFFQKAIEDGKTIFLFVGRLLKDKGVYEFVRAGKRIREKYSDIELWIVGEPDKDNPSSIKEEDIKAWGNEIFIKFFGFMKDVKPILARADCIVLPSYYREGVPRSLLEAMAMEKAIITTDAPGCRDVCLDGMNGFLVEPKSVESLEKAMERYLNLSEEEKKMLGKEGRKMVLEKYDMEIVVKRYMELINACYSSNSES